MPSTTSLIFRLTYLVLYATLASTAFVDLLPRNSSVCNNAASLCSKPYDKVVHLGAHDSPFGRDAATGFSPSGDQYYSSTIQLEAGVRLMTAQVHKSNGDWRLCHSSCDLLDVGSLATWLSEIKAWMDKNPNDVVTILIVNSDGASRADLHAEFLQSGITKYVYTPLSNTPPPSWPTLQTLISADTRLMTFVASLATDGNSDMSYMMDEFTFIFENNYNNNAFSDFSCDPNRPGGLTVESALQSGRMPFMNHFLYQQVGQGIADIQTPAVDNITTTNSPSTTILGALGQSADKCVAAYSGRPPTFILVDFFDQGPAIDTVDRLNGVTSPVGRTKPPPRDMESDRADLTFAGVEALVKQVEAGGHPSMGAWIWGAGRWSLGGINLNGGDLVA